MFTFLREDRVLFPCDLFGSHFASSDLDVRDERAVYQAAKRYYAEIMMPFRNSIKGHIEKVEALDPKIIASSHGPIYRNPRMILDAYKDWISDDVKNEVDPALRLDARQHPEDGRLLLGGADRRRNHREAVQPDEDRYRAARHGARRCRDDRDRDSHCAFSARTRR